MPGSYEAGEAEKEETELRGEQETAKEVVEAMMNQPSPSAASLSSTPAPAAADQTPQGPKGKQCQYDTDWEDSLSEEEQANENPV